MSSPLATSPALDHGIRAPDYRLPAATHVGGVKLQVADLARSVVYYEQVIGLRVLSRDEHGAVLGPHGEDRALVTLREKPGARPVTRRGRLGLFHLAILVPDRPTLGRFLGHLESIGAYAGMSDHLVSEAIYLSDPDGLGIEVYADRPRSSWQYRDRQLEMTTIALDVASVLQAGAGKPWTGMPAGTVVGHVHLSVGHLPDAEHFYHRALGLDKTVWNYPGALFLSAGGYHHHLGTNTWASHAPRAEADDARLLEWELIVPAGSDAAAAAASLTRNGYGAAESADGWRADDPWGTTIVVRGER